MPRRPPTALLLVAVLALTGCGALDAALGDTDGDGRSEPGTAGVTGDPEEWLQAVCGRSADVVEDEPDDDQSDDDAREVERYSCTVPGEDVGDDDVDEYEVQAVIYATDPEDDLVGEADSFKSGDGNELAWAYGETDDAWAVVWLYPSFGEADEAVLEPLQDDGFEVGSVDYGA